MGEQVREELSNLIRNLKDPRVGFISIVKVEVSGDLKHAKVFVSVMGTEEQKKATLTGLGSASGFLRSELSARMSLRFVPEIHWVLDDSIAQGARIARLLVEVRKEQEERDQEP